MAGYWPSCFCEASTQLSSPNKFDWFAHLSSQLEHRICFILPAHRFKYKIVINNYALLTGCEVKTAEYLCLYWPFLPLARLCSKKNWRQPSTLNLWNPVCPAKWFLWKSKDFLVAREQKLQMQAPRATEHSLVLVNKNAKLNEANIQPSWTNKLGQ